MSKDEFWDIIEKSKQANVAGEGSQERVLYNLLKALPLRELEAFLRIQYDLRDDVYRWDLWAAAFLIGGGCSDDAFSDFGAWLLSQGRSAFEATLNDPEYLATIDASYPFFEGFQYVGDEVYRKRTRLDYQYPPREFRRQPKKPEWRFDFEDSRELVRRLPRLWARYGDV